MVNSMKWLLREDDKGYYYEKVDDTVQERDKPHNKCVDLFYQTIQELDKRVLFEDDIKELYSLIYRKSKICVIF